MSYKDLPTKDLLELQKQIHTELTRRYDRDHPELEIKPDTPIINLVEKYNLTPDVYDIVSKYFKQNCVIRKDITVLHLLNLSNDSLSKIVDLNDVGRNNLISSLLRYCSEHNIDFMKYPITK